MADRSSPWRPTPEEVRQIVEEMRPIIRDFARRSASLPKTAATR